MISALKHWYWRDLHEVWLVVAQELAQSAWEEDGPDLNPLISYTMDF